MHSDFQNSDIYKRIFMLHDSIPNRIVSRESSWLEFKESFNWGSNNKYAKSMAAFANNCGGYIVFGIKDQPRELVGLNNNNFETIDESRISSYLNNAFAPEINFEKFTTEVNSKEVGIIYVRQEKSKPIVCIKNDDELKEADIYYRYNARSEKIKYSELKKIFESIKEEVQKSWMEHFERISKIGPTNAAILDTLAGDITGRGGTIIIDKKLIPKLKFIKEGNFQESGGPVLKLIGDAMPMAINTGREKVGDAGIRITDNPEAPAMRIEEEEILKAKYPLDFKDLVGKLSSRYSDFKANKTFHNLKKELLVNEELSRIRYLDPGNPNSPSKNFYSTGILKEFDKHYTIKSRNSA